MTAVLGAGGISMISHEDSFAFWGYGEASGNPTHVSVLDGRTVRRTGVKAHRRSAELTRDLWIRNDIPVTSPALTIIDNARRIGGDGVDKAISEADARGHSTPKMVHEAARRLIHVRGARIVRDLLDRRILMLTQSELERWFARILRQTELPAPLTQRRVNGYRVDFWWPELGLVVETDGGTYHRTPGQQTKDRREDQAHVLAGLVPLRFTHEQVRYHPGEVLEVLVPVAERLRAATR